MQNQKFRMKLSIILALSSVCAVRAKSNILPSPEFDPYDEMMQNYERQGGALPSLYNYPYNYSMGNNIALQVLWSQVIAISGPVGHICSAIAYTMSYETYFQNRTILISSLNPLRKYLNNFDVLEVTWAYGDGMEPPDLFRARIINITRLYSESFSKPLDIYLEGLSPTHDLVYILLDRPMLPSNSNYSLEILRIPEYDVPWDKEIKSFAVSGFGYACADHLFNYLGTMERHWFKAITGCYENCKNVVPKNWGHFICIKIDKCYEQYDSVYFKSKYIMGCESGSPLVTFSSFGFMAFGICSFTMYVDGYLYFIYTNLMKYVPVLESRFGVNKTNVNNPKVTKRKRKRSRTSTTTTTTTTTPQPG